MFEFSKTCWEFAPSFLVCVVKFQINPKYANFGDAIRSSLVQFEFTEPHFDGCNFGGLYLLHPIDVFLQ